ncbi:hypothetical protein AB205_0069170, partial [Aquarana catesbeiana]
QAADSGVQAAPLYRAADRGVQATLLYQAGCCWSLLWNDVDFCLLYCSITSSFYVCFSGKRPFGVSLLYIGWDKHYGFQLYQSDPSGNYGGWKATCIGNNSAAAVSMLKQDYKEGGMTMKAALALAVKVLNKTMDVSKLSAEKVEIATLTRENGKTKIRVLKQKEVEELIKLHEAEEAKIEKEKKEKEQKEKDK